MLLKLKMKRGVEYECIKWLADNVLKLILKRPIFVPFGANPNIPELTKLPAGMSNLASKLGQIGPKGEPK